MGDFVDTAQTPGNLAAYLGLVTSEHTTKPKYIATLSGALQPLMDIQNVLAGMRQAFDVDTAIGVQLDVLGQWVGASRLVPVTITGVYFSWDTAGVGWDQGAWLGPGAPLTTLTTLPDEQFRTLIRARIANNNWDGSINGAYTVGSTIFGTPPPTGYLLRSNIFTTAGGWNIFGSPTLTANFAASPDATSNAWRFARTNTGPTYGFTSFGQTIPPGVPLVDGTLMTFSMYGEAIGGPCYLALGLEQDAINITNHAVFRLDTGAIFTTAGAATATITALPNGWYRCQIHAPANLASGSNLQPTVYFSVNSTGVFWNANDLSASVAAQIYGAQFENAATASPYLNDIVFIDHQDMTMDIRVRGPALDAVTKAMVTSGALDLTPAGVAATYVTP